MGNGTSTYGGITGATLKIRNLSSTRADIAGLYVATGNNPSEVVLNDLIYTAGLLPAYVEGSRKKWYMHNSYYWDVCVRLALAAGGVTEMEIMNTAYTQQPRFLSYPVEFVQAMTSAVGDAAATDLVTILFGDLALAAALGDRRQTTLMQSEHYRFATDQLALRGTERLDINVHDVGNATSTAADKQPGPLVGLLMKAS
jgi:HK97 family phage major capsid protein